LIVRSETQARINTGISLDIWGGVFIMVERADSTKTAPDESEFLNLRLTGLEFHSTSRHPSSLVELLGPIKKFG
jgi:hypothetical protein